MSKISAFGAALVLTVLLPGTARAGAIMFEGPAAAWKPAVVPGNSNGQSGYWDQKSYDSLNNSPVGACGAGPLVAGAPCDWAGPPPQTLTSPRAAAPNQLLEYFGLTNPAPGGSDAPLNFYFTGAFDFDWAVLFQLTAWADTVEFGWYDAGQSDSRHPMIGPGGPYSANNGLIGTTGSTSIPTGDFGFYYRNTRYGSEPDNEVVFFTQSRLNKVGNYYAYFTDPESGIWLSPPRLDDEMQFREIDLSAFQQFVAFRQGNRYWLGLEDQFGHLNPQFCYNPQDQPCSDYDFNDFIINFDERSVPEPASLSLLALGVFGAAWARRRRQ